MNLEQFKINTLGGSFGNPKTGTYRGECVSYARKYMEEVLDISTYPDGDAKDYWNNSISTKNFDKVGAPQNGDVVVYGANPKNKYGHIGIWYNGQLLSQNYNIPLHVTIASLNLPNRLGYLRKKGNQVPEDYKLNKGDVVNYFRDILGHEATQADINAWTGQTHKKFLYEKVAKEGLQPPNTQYVEAGEVDGKKVYRRK